MKKLTRIQAILIALFVVFLWSTSWILMKIGLKEMPPLTLSGYRYAAAFLVLLPFLLRRKERAQIKALSKGQWRRLIALGVVYIGLVQSTQVFALKVLPAASVSLILNFTTVLVTFLGSVLLREKPTILQYIGIGINLSGTLTYFYPVHFSSDQVFGLTMAIICLILNVFAVLMNRRVNRDADIPPLIVNGVTMGIGGLLMLGAAFIMDGFPAISLQSWLIILWLAAVNTAFAFTLWYRALQTLTAMESSIINSLMIVLVSVWAWILLAESLDVKGVIGLALAAMGTLLVQIRRLRKEKGDAG